MVTRISEDSLALEHPARLLWELFGMLDLSAFTAGAKAVQGVPGGSLKSRRMLLTLWAYALVRGIVSELTGLPADHPAVARGCVSVMAPCFMLLIFDRPTLRRAFPEFGFGPADAAAVTDHLVQQDTASGYLRTKCGGCLPLLPRKRAYKWSDRAGAGFSSPSGPVAGGHADHARPFQPDAAFFQALHPEHGPFRGSRRIF